LGAYEAQGLPKNISFDRIHVSNIIDTEYVGIANVLADWAPLLNETNKCATIIAYSMNWVQTQRNSEPDPKTAVMEKILKQLIVMGKVNINLFPSNHSLSILPIYRLVKNMT
jgi:hypothetical protein